MRKRTSWNLKKETMSKPENKGNAKATSIATSRATIGPTTAASSVRLLKVRRGRNIMIVATTATAAGENFSTWNTVHAVQASTSQSPACTRARMEKRASEARDMTVTALFLICSLSARYQKWWRGTRVQLCASLGAHRALEFSVSPLAISQILRDTAHSR